MSKPTPSGVRYDQAQRIIDKFGGPYELAKVSGITASVIYRWTYPKERGGTGGLIPTRSMPTVVKAARLMGVFLDHKDLYPQPIEEDK